MWQKTRPLSPVVLDGSCWQVLCVSVQAPELVETVQTTETMRWYEVCFYHQNGGFNMFLPSKRVDLLWETRILHDFTKQKWWFSIFLTKKTWKHMKFTYKIFHHQFFLTKNPWGFHPEVLLGSSPPESQGPRSGPRGSRQVSPFWSGSRLPSAPASRKTWSSCAAKGWGLGMLGVGGFWWGDESSNILKHGGLKQEMDRNDGKRSPGSAFFCWFKPAFCLFVTMKPYDLLIFNHKTIWFNQQRLPFNDGKLRFKPFFRFDEVFMGISGWFG